MKKITLAALLLAMVLLPATFAVAEGNDIQIACVQLPICCNSNSDCTCSHCCADAPGPGGCARVCQPSCNRPMDAIPSGVVALNREMTLGDNCIEKGQVCVLNGTPCCAPYECKGKFPNTTCQ